MSERNGDGHSYLGPQFHRKLGMLVLGSLEAHAYKNYSCLQHCSRSTPLHRSELIFFAKSIIFSLKFVSAIRSLVIIQPNNTAYGGLRRAACHPPQPMRPSLVTSGEQFRIWALKKDSKQSKPSSCDLLRIIEMRRNAFPCVWYQNHSRGAREHAQLAQVPKATRTGRFCSTHARISLGRCIIPMRNEVHRPPAPIWQALPNSPNFGTFWRDRSRLYRS